MKQLKIGRAKGRWTNWSWDANARDCAVMADLLYKGSRAIGLRRRPGDIAGWPEVQREIAPTALDTGERQVYDATWREFRRELGLLGGSTRRPVGWAADLRFRQKASLLRVAGTTDFAQDLLEAGQQVAISVAFLETSSHEVVIAPLAISAERPIVVAPPLRGEWIAGDPVHNGPDAAHRRAVMVEAGHAWISQRYAIDWVQYATVDGKRTTWRGPEDRNESYFCWDKPIYSVAAGTVIDASDCQRTCRIPASMW